MRIAIDLCVFQQADTSLAHAGLAMVRHMSTHPGEHMLWIAFSNRFPDTIERLRAAFSDHMASERLLTYDLPVPDGSGRTGRWIELIRENFFASLGADIVLRPGADAGAPVSVHFLDAAGLPARDADTGGQPAATLAIETGKDPAAAAQQVFQGIELALRQRPRPALPSPRPLLAWITAQETDGAGPDAALLMQLARHYEVHLVVPAPGAACQHLPFPLHGIDWLEQHAVGSARMVYDVRNSEQHSFMPALLARYSGVVLLKDFFLGAVFRGKGMRATYDVLFASHGFTGLSGALELGLPAAAERYPLNKAILELASGVIVDSTDLLAQADTWYGSGAASRWRCLPAPQEAGALQTGDAAGTAYADAIEAFTRRSPAAHYRALLQGVRAAGSPGDALDPALAAAAMSIAANQPPMMPRQLLVDVSAMVQLDAKTGISRVVRSILLALIAAPPPGYRVEAVHGDGGNRRYRYARTFTLGLIGAGAMGLQDSGLDDISLEDAPIEHRPGDIFLGVDVAASITTQNASLLADMRRHGVGVFFVVYDILPLLLPDKFAYGTDTYFRKYLETITRHADGLLCNTRATADTLAEWVVQHPPARPTALQIGSFHLGADLAASAPSTGLPGNAADILAAAASRPTLLMVGTIEPRKAQGQALAALDLLWSQGADVNLVIVGKAGWMVETLIKQLKKHPQLDRRLFWLTEASDEMLERLYGSCSALLAASLGEGFGLPLIEAAQHGLPIIARRLAVFEEICGTHAYYFDGETPQQLADALRTWLALFAAGQAPASAGLPWLSWAESAAKLLACVIGKDWYRSLPASAGSL